MEGKELPDDEQTKQIGGYRVPRSGSGQGRRRWDFAGYCRQRAVGATRLRSLRARARQDDGTEFWGDQ